jgi:hypothetical protein
MLTMKLANNDDRAPYNTTTSSIPSAISAASSQHRVTRFDVLCLFKVCDNEVGVTHTLRNEWGSSEK